MNQTIPDGSWEKVDLEGVAHILASIAEKYPSDSPEYKAIELAAKALLFVMLEAAHERFVRFMEKEAMPMSEHERKHYEYIMGELRSLRMGGRSSEEKG